jgi:TIR domain
VLKWFKGGTMAFEYDVFISYTSDDRPWALKLNEALGSGGKGFKIFIDRERLDVGKEWEPQLKEALTKSRHLVSIWSKKAHQSGWVQRELATFDVFRSDKRKNAPDRRLIFLNLQDQAVAYSSYQMIEDFKEGNVYEQEIDQLDKQLWSKVVNKISNAVEADDSTIPISLVILTLKQMDVDSLNANQIDTIQQCLGIDRGSLDSLYGPEREDWKPFGNATTVLQLLEDIKDDVNRTIDGPKFRWELTPEEFWTHIPAAQRYHSHFLESKLSLLVIDPVAIHVHDVYQRLMIFQDCIERSNTAIIVLPPFSINPNREKLRDWIKSQGSPYFDDYFDPKVPPRTRYTAHCGFNVNDREDIRRLMLLAVGQFISESPSKNRPNYIKFG